MRAFWNFPYSVQPPNFYGWRLAELAQNKRLVKGKSLEQLRRWCRVDGSVNGEALTRAIRETNRRWRDEYEEER